MARTKHGTLTAGVVTPVAISNHAGAVEVLNRSGYGTLYVRTDGVDPTVGGDDSIAVTGSRRVKVTTSLGTNASVRLVSADPLEYSVEAGDL